MTTSEKTCFKCSQRQPLSEFYKHSQMADGHLNKCKHCTKNDAHRHRRDPRFREKVLAYDRMRGSRQGADYVAAKRECEPAKFRARNAVSNAVRDGRLVKPDRCTHCSAKASRIVGHHPDYSKPLEVVWLCDACHRQLHAFMDTVQKATG